MVPTKTFSSPWIRTMQNQWLRKSFRTRLKDKVLLYANPRPIKGHSYTHKGLCHAKEDLWR
jgi:hypothetical protein